VTLTGLQGASGTGKSTLLRQIGEALNNKGDIAIWVSEKLVEESNSFPDLILRALRIYYPTLNADAGNEAIHIISTSACKFFVLVDDINRSSNPDKLIDILEERAKSIENKQVKFIVPLWLGQLAATPKETPKKENILWETIEISTYSNAEKLRLSKKYPRDKVDQIIEALNGDPFLCGIALENGEVSFSYNSFIFLMIFLINSLKIHRKP
jgi:ABC-type cobalamin/Fe3+-siderophores transport system ATPase subunit